MARAIAILKDCRAHEDGVSIELQFCLGVTPEAGDNFPSQDHTLVYLTNGNQTQTQLNNGVQAEAIAQMALLGITLTGAKVIQTKFT